MTLMLIEKLHSTIEVKIQKFPLEVITAEANINSTVRNS